MYPRMHKVLGVGIEEFIEWAYRYASNVMVKFTVQRRFVWQQFEAIKKSADTVNESDIVNFMREFKKFDQFYHIIYELKYLFDSYAHTDEFNSVLKNDDFATIKANFDKIASTDYAFHRYTYKDVNDTIKMILIERGFLDSYAEMAYDNFPRLNLDDATSEDVWKKSYWLWRKSLGLFANEDEHINFIEEFGIDEKSFIAAVHDEMMLMYEYNETVGYSIDVGMKLVIVENHPISFDDFTNMYFNYYVYNGIRRAMSMLHDYTYDSMYKYFDVVDRSTSEGNASVIGIKVISYDNAEKRFPGIRETLTAKQQLVRKFRNKMDLFNYLFIQDKLNMGHLKYIPGIEYKNGKYLNVSGMAIKVQQFMNKFIIDNRMSEFYRNYYHDSI